MNDLDIKLAIAQPSVRARIQELMLSDGEVSLMVSIASGNNTSSKIASEYDISIQSASGRLAVLKRKGYVTRRLEPQDSGGYEYVYTNLVKIGDRNYD